MNALLEERAVKLAQYIVEQQTTVRQAAKQFHISKSTVHKDVSQRLKRLSPQLYSAVCAVLAQNKSERHIRGGMTTKQKYENLRSK